jgi:hypothetical protein
MRQVFEELGKLENYNFLANYASSQKIAEVVWALYYKERDAGNFKIKVLFFTKDISGIVAQLITKWFGTDPLAVS